MRLTILTVVLATGTWCTRAQVCTRAQPNASWPWYVGQGTSNSCASSNGGTNDLGNMPQMCENKMNSVRIEVTAGKAECLVATAAECKIPMHDFVALDYDVAIDSCLGVWAAPLWMTPDKWQWGPGSGEIDSLEFCSRDSVHMNFAGGGHQLQSNISIENGESHVTVRKDVAGIVTIATCTQAMAVANGGQCDRPVYTDCNSCLWGKNNTFACWCNAESDNIYGSGGCAGGGDCTWTLVSDIWNGVRGDGGYQACMTAVPSIGLDKGKPNLKSRCKFSIENILVRGGGPNNSMQWGAGSPSTCSVLTTNPKL